MKLQTSVNAWLDTAAADLRALGELATEVQAAVFTRQRRIRRAAATTSGRDLMWESCAMAYDIIDLADAARRARSDRPHNRPANQGDPR
ncbi:hypothetical protein [Nocardia sp. AG03]|uniref:hypothetical protein n=1 Tax=Nocardia sp. AG03 TaxID=3025312 RepID=UPI00241863EE|nr:hypothetical protein [Nocardia sp. AG03]